ncbi:Vacuolar calcium ion transporter [Penicillium macrosclerotiorum]|uniref:Vacuolar calcium ion transporter n=1 Tax=Penicillium macrosclerotiorum TaxID=303699 RepID=UPI002548323A|nr:Vacuolar calcium ion transporter [Penicillium macrosclerotiorum]KAJ5674205.1 Vacuolar calcium ion transporter [Penicillium macrosclerotiorum]
MALDIYRRKARNLAWYDQDGEPASHNPFKKFRRRPTRTASIPLEDQGRPRDPDRDVENSPYPPESAGSDWQTNGSYGGPEPSNISQDPINADTVTTSRGGIDFEAEIEGNQARQRGPKKSGFLGKFKRQPSEEHGPEDSKPLDEAPRFTVASQIRATVLNSWINILIVAAPVGIALHAVDANPIAIFVVNFIAIIPLAAMLSYATEEIAMRTGETIGGLLNASFGNAVELIVAIIALVKKEVLIVQTSLIGSMLSNLLLVMGMCFFFGGLERMEQHFNVTVAQTAASLLALAVSSLIIPTAFHTWSSAKQDHTAELSRGTSVLLLIVYGCYLFFQLKSHTDMYNAPSQKVEKRSKSEGDANRGIAQIGKMTATTMGGRGAAQEVQFHDPEDEDEQPQLTLWVAGLTLCVSTALVAVCAEFMVDSIDALTTTTNISETFVGLILLPIVGNAAEHATAVTVAWKDKMDLAIGVAVGSSMQIALLVLPLIVVIGWIMGVDNMTLNFDSFEVILLFVSVLLVNYLIGDGKSHWLEGVLLMMMYLIIAIAAWFFD